MLKQNLSAYDKALVLVIFAVIALVLEVVFVYQYVTTGIVTFSPTAMIRGDGAFYFIIIAGIASAAFIPIAIMRFVKVLQSE